MMHLNLSDYDPTRQNIVILFHLCVKNYVYKKVEYKNM